MKHFSFLLFASLFCSTSVFAQKNMLTLGLFYLPKSENALAHGSLSYYHHLERRHSIGVRAMFGTDGIGASEEAGKVFVGNVDLVHRWTTIKKGGHFKMHLNAGLSVSGTREKRPPYYYGYCGTGLTPDIMQEIEREIHRKQNEIIFRTGIASAVSWEFAVSKYFGLGFGAIFNAYFSPKDGWQFLPLPNLNAAYYF